MSDASELQAEIDRRRMAAELDAEIASRQGGSPAGLGKALATGVRSGVEGIPGAAGDLREGSQSAISRMAQWLGMSPETADTTGDVVSRSLMLPGVGQLLNLLPDSVTETLQPTSAQVGAATDQAVAATLPAAGAEAVQDITRHEPQGAAEHAMQTVGEFVPNAVGPGGIMSKVSRVLFPAAATEGAGEVAKKINPEWEDAARLVAGVLSGAGTSAATNSFRTRSALRTVGTTPAAAKRVQQLLVEQGMSPEDAYARMKELGSGSTVADTGPNVRQEAQRIQAAGGEGRGVIDPYLRGREAAANQRLERDVTDVVGPPQQRSVVEKALADRKKALEPEYTAAHKAQAKPVDTQSVLDDIDTDLATEKNPALRKKMQQVRDSLHIMDQQGVATPNLDPSTEGLHKTRKFIDDMLYDQSGKPKDIGGNEARLLKKYRRQIDEALGEAGPIKDVDVKFEQIAKEGEAVESGRNIYDTGKDTMSPEEFRKQRSGMTPGEKAGQETGLNLETWRQLGIFGNDRVKLQSLLKGEGKWNYEKVAAVVGERKASQLMSALEREKTFNETYGKVVQGSKTAETGGRNSNMAGDVADVAIATASGGPQAGFAVGATKAARGALAKVMTSAKGDKDIAQLLMSQNPDDIVRAAQIMKRRGSPIPGAVLSGILANAGGD